MVKMLLAHDFQPFGARGIVAVTARFAVYPVAGEDVPDRTLTGGCRDAARCRALQAFMRDDVD